MFLLSLRHPTLRTLGMARISRATLVDGWTASSRERGSVSELDEKDLKISESLDRVTKSSLYSALV